MTLRKRLFSPEEMDRAVDAMAMAILEECRRAGDEEFALVGLYQQGVPLAEHLADAMERVGAPRPWMGRLDISLYRDDFGQKSALPIIRETVIPFDVNATRIILVDDVLSTGRTIRAALDALTDYGRPGIIRLAVLIDRGSPEFPIRADYVGMACPASPARKIAVQFEGDPEARGVFEVDWQERKA